MYQFGAFSPLLASLISVGPFQFNDMINRDVIKCNHFYRQLPSSAFGTPAKNARSAYLMLSAL
jgi:hypothetical protein